YETENINVVDKIVKLVLLDQGASTTDHIEHMIRIGQDVRYSIDDTKLRNLGWKPQADFDKELVHIVQYYKHKFIW
ncbi:MAG: dTDP-glucose 4,6-dehydratase, partial [Micrococcales bacterium]|nr:dTDP-glucose 4,6-dehydratase [Micrococcales bacterium]